MKRFKVLYNLFLFVLIICSNYAYSQSSENTKPRNNQLFLEFGGNGIYGSLNYERLILKKKQIGVKGGVSTYNMIDFEGNLNPDLIIPYGVSFLKGKNLKFEFGVGQTITSVVTLNTDQWEKERVYRVHGNFLVGIRYQKQTKGLVFRGGYSPIIQDYLTYKHWAYISVGYGF